MEKRYALITGATSGIGEATAKIFLKNNYLCFLVGRDIEKLKEIEKNFKKNSFIFKCNLLEDEGREKLKDFIFERTDYLNVLVNSAGIIKSGNIENTEIKDLKEMMEINLYAPFHLIKCFLPLLKKRNGSIINVSSVTGKRAFPNVLSYCISKAALDHMTRCLALELAPYGIRVNSVNPGVVITNLHKRGGMDEENYQKFLENSKKTHPLGRVGNPEEVAELIYFLAGEKAGWITGETISIDGGRAQTCLR